MGSFTDTTRIQGNIIEDSQLDVFGRSAGIVATGDSTNTLIGGSGVGEGNTIRNNGSAGIYVQELNASAISLTVTPSNVSILGNSIYGTLPVGGIFGTNSLGIDILSSTDTTGPTPDGIPESYLNLGPTPNDSTDADTGPNNYMNFPVLNNAIQNDNQLTVDLNLDAAGTTDVGGNYRIEFFANDTADSSGYGEGQTYLGSANIANGNNQTATITLPTNTDLTGKVLSATTTAIDSSTPSSFGSTSEFSEVAPITVLSTTAPDQLASTGENLWLWLTGTISLIGVGVYMAQVVGRR